LKRLCRLFDIKRWPYRRLQALQHQQNIIQTNIHRVPSRNNELQDKADEVQQEIDHIRQHGLKKGVQKRKRVTVTGLKKRGRPPKNTTILQMEQEEIENVSINQGNVQHISVNDSLEEDSRGTT
jgi:hypothetical protein